MAALCELGGYRANEFVLRELRSVLLSEVVDALVPMTGEFFSTREACKERICELSAQALSAAEARSIALRMRRYRIRRGLQALIVLRDFMCPLQASCPS